jgi:DNA-binding NtrC family response regulator
VKPKNRIYILDDEDLVVTMLGRALRGEGYEVLGDTSPQDAAERIRAFSPDVALLDIKLPGRSGIDILGEVVASGIGTQVVMLSSDDTAGTAVQAMKLGAKDYLTKPFDLEKVKIVIRGLIERMDLRNEIEYLRRISEEVTRREIIGKSGTIMNLRSRCEKLARANIPTLLITGESGTGKEMFARHIHDLIREAPTDRIAPFVGINCAALPEPLVESELFGHERGAFTDAKAEKKGVFEMAIGGAILLDEIGEMKPSLQAKLLRVLEERSVRRIGGKHDIPVDATVFATTNRNLGEAVERGDFRVDLYHRLNAFSLHIPPLRERKEDIPLLIRHFLSYYGERYKKISMREVSPRAEKLLMEYLWPGNVRELRNVVERIVVLESGDAILPEHLPPEISSRREPAQRTGSRITIPDKGLSLEELERDLIVQALEKTGGNKTAAAKLLNISYDSLRYQVKRLGLE